LIVLISSDFLLSDANSVYFSILLSDNY